MKITAILNRDGGTLKTMDLQALQNHLISTFKQAGDQVECKCISGEHLSETLQACADDTKCDCIMVAGGDGTVAAAAAVAWKTGKILAVLPAGTMNFFAKSLQMPLNVEDAAVAMADGRIRDVDIATANGQPFVHQYSVGFHARAVQLRNKMKYGSKFGKIRASMKAIWTVISNPPTFEADVECDAATKLPGRMSSLAVSNNVFGEGHLPYADDLQGGKLGIYCAEPVSQRQAAKLIYHVMIGTIANNERVTTCTTEATTLRFKKKNKKAKALLDGEIIDLKEKVDIRIHKEELMVLVPKGHR